MTDSANNQIHEFSESVNNLSVTLGKKITIKIIAEDTGGVKRIAISGGGEYTCTNGVFSSDSQMLYETKENNSAPDVYNQVWPRVFLTVEQTYNWNCQTDWIYAGGQVEYHGEAENYYHGKRTSILILYPTPSLEPDKETDTPTLNCPNCIPVLGKTPTQK